MVESSQSPVRDGILDNLEELGYKGSLNEATCLQSAIDGGLSSHEFINLVDLLCTELRILLNMEESVTRASGPQDADSFNMEMRSFVSELGCPHQSLLQDLTALDSPQNRLLLIDFLTSQLMAARLIYVRKQKKSDEAPDDDSDSNPYNIATNLSTILKTYGVSRPPAHVTTTMLFDKIISKTKQLVTEAPKDHMTPSLVTQGLSVEQWATLDRINEALTEEYSLRRRMLLTRCNVTVKSFKWSDKAKVFDSEMSVLIDKEEQFSVIYQERQSSLRERAPILIARVLTAKKDILSIERTSSGTVRKNTQCEVNKVLMGNVPDRGGRPNETRPPPEMPSFKKRTEPPPQERRDKSQWGGRGKRGGAAGGGRVQGGWSGRGGRGDWDGQGGGGGGYHGNWEPGHSDGYGYQGGTYGREYQGGYGGYQGGYDGSQGHGGYQQGGGYGGYQGDYGGHGGYQQDGGYGGYRGDYGGYQRGSYGGYGRGGGRGNWRGGRGEGGGGGQYHRQNSGQQYYYS